MSDNNNVNKTEYGYDITWIETEFYTSKIKVFEKANSKTPIGFHKNTTKSWFINAGTFNIRWIDTKTGELFERELSEGIVFHVPALMPCGLESLSENSSLSETSNINDPEDFYKLSS